TITVPSPTGMGNSTATINYTPGSDFVSSLVDANGNSRNYSSSDVHTTLTVMHSNANTLYSAITGFDGTMHPASVTDGTNSHVYCTTVHADPNDPDRPSLIRDGAANDSTAKTTSMTWDQYGHLTSVTTARNTQVVYTWDYSVFSLGRLTSVREGSKTASTFSYFEPSGLV